MKKIFLIQLLAGSFMTKIYAHTNITTSIIVPQSYKQALQSRNTHKFDDNQIRAFVYYWYGLHDKHAEIQKSYELLNKDNLLMVFPEITVHNLADYKKWYDGVGKNIKSNLHIVKELKIALLPNHQYKVDLAVNWQGINKDDQFIDVVATQEWLLVDGKSNTHPYIKEYKVLGFQSGKIR